MTDQQGSTFYEATRDVFKMMLGLDIAQLETYSAADGEETVQIAIELIGDLTGSVVYSFPKTTALNIVKTLSGMESGAIDEFATSMLGEISNIISGNAVTILSSYNCNCDIRPPQITIRNNTAKIDDTVVYLCLQSEVGQLYEHVLLS
ncbi:chemotaxis protein CheX [Acetanaerobacterium elongatum]|uniref:Chemotaxis protein CheX n=1 Tax=Acetanaerobacterium elongatum TaxID=258515 RepID=A0A1G9ZQU3_9FIRM|nr:chemotaxis protein CheX [Acetanaerobacterium elongatum]SDN23590.1 chemotaxis protein CheX [Acetanaerobacterium elongatum]